MKKATKNQIIKWHNDGLTIDEFASIIPQYCREEIEAVIKEYEKKEAWNRLMS
jgi:uncharacterized protein (DUF433 family)|nr:MAG TPA: Protein of unknown function (DUF433) [Caudoviricetes sp.]